MIPKTEMKASDRRTAILSYLQTIPRASTHSLSEQFQVSEVTIRTDLRWLESQGNLVRIHGGALSGNRVVPEQSFAQRRAQKVEEKQRMARAASAEVRPGDTIILDDSTSAFFMTPHLRDITPLRVVTSGLQVASTLAPVYGIEVVLVGGVLKWDTASLVGTLAEEVLAKIHAAKSFLGSSGLVLDRGLTDADFREVQVKRAIIKAVDHVNVLIDSSKFGCQSFLSFATLDDIDHVYCTGDIPPEYARTFENLSIEVTIA